MLIIPVIDVMGGIVVRARMGARDQYRRIDTVLSRTANIDDIVRGFLNFAPFTTFYLADLDAIRGTGSNFNVFLKLKETFPLLTFCIDCGVRTQGAINIVAAVGDPVLGSESQIGSQILFTNPHLLLSLDFIGDKFVGPPEILDSPALWPKRVIVMSLERVGSASGPDLERLKSVQLLAGSRQIYAAGGVRNAEDLATLREAGVHGVLVASALHDGKLRFSDIA